MSAILPKLTTEAHVQQTVVEFLELDGWRAIRTDPVSDRCRGKGFGEVGMPDYLFLRYNACYTELNGARKDFALGFSTYWWTDVLWIEFKRKGKKPTPHQSRWHETEKLRGAMVLTVDDIDEFTRWYKASGLNRRMVA